MGDNWVHKYNNLKKLHKLVTRYLEEKQGQSLSKLDPPNLNMIAKDGDSLEVLKLCELVIAVAVQCDRNQHYIQKIQTLPEISQHALMISLEQVKITRKEKSLKKRDKREVFDEENTNVVRMTQDLTAGQHHIFTLLCYYLDHSCSEQRVCQRV